MTDNFDISSKDLYKVLECLPNSSSEEVKQAYHRKILKTHPDKNDNSSENIETFHDVKTAWKILGNPDLRKKYDTQCKQIDLEAKSELTYARLTSTDLEKTEDNSLLSYQCRCGSSYIINKSDLEQPNCVIHVPCQDCTFIIAVET